MTDRWTVAFDRHICVGTGLCAATAPDALDLDENGKGCATAETLPASEAVRDAAESCPVEAITITDAGTGERVFP
ncbi:ferredoxin [Actinomadura rugatobispora]|uniref:Ferredoxin n=1 Tax=Actinomadura rugatobispora TaxID=1994 RepID=A0ABW1A3Y4_9ACTN|nr:ferredoxin [Actinomadura rugatobispora]